jgi:hypothetical protein
MVDNSHKLSFRNVKILYIIIEALKLNHVIDVLKCFPCLQQFHIRVSLVVYLSFWRLSSSLLSIHKSPC